MLENQEHTQILYSKNIWQTHMSTKNEFAWCVPMTVWWMRCLRQVLVVRKPSRLNAYHLAYWIFRCSNLPPTPKQSELYDLICVCWPNSGKKFHVLISRKAALLTMEKGMKIRVLVSSIDCSGRSHFIYENTRDDKAATYSGKLSAPVFSCVLR